MKKVGIAFLIILVGVSGFLVGLYLLQEQQDIREQAAVPGGQATVSISPSSGDFEVGDNITAEVSFNTSGIPISGVAVRLLYPFSGISPEISVIRVQVDEDLLASGNWSCPTRNAFQQGGNVFIDVACANLSASGFVSNSNIKLATIEMRVNRLPSTNPLVLRFDPQQSVITRRNDNQDILLIPQSQGSYIVKALSSPTTAPSVTPVPTEVTMTSTPTATRSLTMTVTVPLSPTKTIEPSITDYLGSEKNLTPTKAKLPEAGVSIPTVLGAVLGILIVVGAILLAL